MTPAQTFANALIEAHRTGQRADVSSLPLPGFAEALEIQQKVQADLGTVAGFKVARSPEGPPIMAPIAARRVVQSGAEVSVQDVLGIELEVGFEVLSVPTGDPLDHPERHFRPRIVIELVDTRMAGSDHAPLAKLADMQINAGLVVGPALDGWDGRDFGVVDAALRCGDTQVIDGQATVPGGSALANLALLCAHVGNHCGGLQAGQIVITGSLSGLEYFPAGTDVIGRIDGLGEIRCFLR